MPLIVSAKDAKKYGATKDSAGNYSIGGKDPTSPTGKSGTRYGATGYDASKDTSNIQKQLENVADSLIASGKTINPNINFDDISLEQFLAEAEKTIAPEYKQKFDTALSDLNLTLDRLGYDLTTKLDEVKRVADKTRTTGREEFAGAGTALSSNRATFEKDVNEAEARQKESERELKFRDAQDVFTATERYLGTSKFKGNAPSQSFAGRSLQFSDNPVVGSMESERQFMKEQIARQLMSDEYQRRAYTISSLGFQ